jgi:hypothetical protein
MTAVVAVLREYMTILLDEKCLQSSSVVANCAMNRERGCLGGNSYEKELSFNPVEFLLVRLAQQKQVSWLDLCCGIRAEYQRACRGLQEVVN